MPDGEVIGRGDAGNTGADDGDLDVLGGAQGETPKGGARSVMLC
jgi:hypothetical protein